MQLYLKFLNSQNISGINNAEDSQAQTHAPPVLQSTQVAGPLPPLAPSLSNIDSDDLINVQDNFLLQEDGSFMPFNIDDAIISHYEEVEITMADDLGRPVVKIVTRSYSQSSTSSQARVESPAQPQPQRMSGI